MADIGIEPQAIRYITAVFAVTAAEAQKLRHDPLELFTRAVQPVLWLLLFGEVMARVRGISPENVSYLDFLSAGILAQVRSSLQFFTAFPPFGNATSASCTVTL